MRADRAFLDTNLFAYLYSGTDTGKRRQVTEAINRYECFISTQVLNEFCNVCIRKLKLPTSSIEKAVEEIRNACNLIMVDDATVLTALGLHARYGYGYYDCLILASASESKCRYLLSEDMADGQIVNETLTIRNIFRPPLPEGEAPD